VDDLLASALAGSARHGAIVRFGRPAVVGPWALRQVLRDVHLPTYAGVGRAADALTSTEAYRRLVRALVNRLKAVDPRTADRVLAVSFAIISVVALTLADPNHVNRTPDIWAYVLVIVGMG